MKSNYRLLVYKTSGELVTLDAYCSRYQVDRAFYALCYMLNQKPYRLIKLALVAPYGLEILSTCEVNDG